MSYPVDSPLDGKRILVIEDREENRRLLRAILRIEGATMLEAERSKEGIEKAESELPDLILMDFQMPDMDGIEATRRLRQNPKTNAIPIIFVTASAGDETRREALEAGSDGFLTKPFDPTRLVTQIAEILSLRGTPNRSSINHSSMN
jgi:two-component system cell cycle response regulator DivK